MMAEIRNGRVIITPCQGKKEDESKQDKLQNLCWWAGQMMRRADRLVGRVLRNEKGAEDGNGAAIKKQIKHMRQLECTVNELCEALTRIFGDENTTLEMRSALTIKIRWMDKRLREAGMRIL